MLHLESLRISLAKRMTEINFVHFVIAFQAEVDRIKRRVQEFLPTGTPAELIDALNTIDSIVSITPPWSNLTPWRNTS